MSEDPDTPTPREDPPIDLRDFYRFAGSAEVQACRRMDEPFNLPDLGASDRATDQKGVAPARAAAHPV